MIADAKFKEKKMACTKVLEKKAEVSVRDKIITRAISPPNASCQFIRTPHPPNHLSPTPPPHVSIYSYIAIIVGIIFVCVCRKSYHSWRRLDQYDQYLCNLLETRIYILDIHM